MRALIIGLSLLIAVPVLAQEQTSSSEVNPETQAVLERVDSAGEWVSTTLGALADKLGTTVEYLWPTFVKEVIAENAGLLGKGLFLWVLAAVFFVILTKIKDWGTKYRKLLKGEDANFADAVMWVSAFCRWALLLILLIWGGFKVFDGAVGMIAPEPQALQNIAEAINTLK